MEKQRRTLYELTNNGEAFSIVIHSGDVYMAGYEFDGSSNVAKVWKNGKELYSLADKGIALSIFIAERK